MNRKTIVFGCLMLAVALVVSAPALTQVKKYDDIKYPKLADFDIPSPEVFTLDNGLTVFLLEDRELPLISVTARVRTGSNYMPALAPGM